jgi:nitroreductase
MSNYRAWDVDERDFPQKGSLKDQLEFIVQYGVLAPSTFNAQPWACRISESKVDVYLDKERLPVKSDKSGRFGYISMGCFIENLLVAASHFVLSVAEKRAISSDGERFEHIASISVAPKNESGSPEDLFGAISSRATNRSPRLSKPLPPDMYKAIANFIPGKVSYSWLGAEAQDALIKLSHNADMAIWSDIEFRREHVAWVRSNWTRKFDGMPGFGVGVSDLPSLLARPVILSSKFAPMQAKKNENALRMTYDFLVLTGEDGPSQWVDIGKAFERIALYLAQQGIAIAPMGQFIEHEETRNGLQTLIGSSRLPQIFCRVGYPSAGVKHSPRRPVADILLT